MPKLTLLLGAGFSVSAGIPSAASIVRDMLRPHPLLAHSLAVPPGRSEYAHLMSELTPADRMDVIQRCIAKAQHGTPPRTRLNWAHFLTATLVYHGYVKQILTTNFDPLLVDAMAITDQAVQTFDLTAADWYMPGRANRGSIMYLHGQAHGLLQAHTRDEAENVRPRIRSVLQEALQDSVLLVIGYSGLSDLVFEELCASFPQFRNRLYWAYYDPAEPEPPQHLRDLVGAGFREAYFLRDSGDNADWVDADTAMHRLVIEELHLTLPPVVSDPLKHLRRVLERLCGVPKLPDGRGEVDPAKHARDLVERAEAAIRIQVGRVLNVSQHSSPQAQGKDREAINDLDVVLAALMADEVRLHELRPYVESLGSAGLKAKLGDGYRIAAARELDKNNLEKALPLLRAAEDLGTTRPEWLQLNWGNALSAQAKQREGAEAEELFREAGERYCRALAIRPDMHEALNNWGIALSAQAKERGGPEADDLFRLAGEKFEAALVIKPSKHEALNNWGIALSAQAKQKVGAEADNLFRLAGAKFDAALDIKPDKPETLVNWGNTLSAQARQKVGPEADYLFQLAGEKYETALAIRPAMPEALNNLGITLSAQAKQKVGPEADDLFRRAGANYDAALAIKPDMHEALVSWGNTLSERARRLVGPEADELFRQASSKYEAALEMNPDMDEALVNWGTTLSAQANQKAGPEADDLLRLAGEKYERALAIRTDMHEALNNWGNTLRDRARRSVGPEAEVLFRLARSKFEAALKIKPDKHDALFNWGNALSDQAQQKVGLEADALLRRAGERYQAALAIKPDMPDALVCWGNTLSDRARRRGGPEADDLFRLAGEKFEAALAIKPDMPEALFNLACMNATLVRVDDSIHYLRLWITSDAGAGRDQIDSDPDFDSIRDDPAFQTFLREAFGPAR